MAINLKERRETYINAERERLRDQERMRNRYDSNDVRDMLEVEPKRSRSNSFDRN
jgi:hypothetical protein